MQQASNLGKRNESAKQPLIAIRNSSFEPRLQSNQKVSQQQVQMSPIIINSLKEFRDLRRELEIFQLDLKTFTNF